MAAPILPLKTTEAGWECTMLTRWEKKSLFMALFYDIMNWHYKHTKFLTTEPAMSSELYWFICAQSSFVILFNN